MKTKLFLLLFFFPLWLSSCGDDDNSVPEPPVEKRGTVLVYMAADNSLSHFASEDLEEMKEGWASMNTSGKHLLVYVDTGTSPRLIELKKNGKEVEEKVIKEYADRNSVGVAEMQEVFKDVFQNTRFQAGSYGFVYWSHGDGWIPNPLPSTRWMGQDTGNGTHYMNIDALASVLETAPRFDFILFDACFMQSVEVAYELKKYTDYYIGSPAENPGPGAPYDRIVPYMFQKGAADKIASECFAVYRDKYDAGHGISNSNWTGGTAICVLKTSELENLASATRNALAGVAADTDGLRDRIFDTDRRNSYSSSYVGYFDFVEMMETLVEDASALATWRRAFDAAVCYWNTTPKIYSAISGMFSMERSHGVTHYIPSFGNNPEEAEAYRSMAWYAAVGLDLTFSYPNE